MIPLSLGGRTMLCLAIAAAPVLAVSSAGAQEPGSRETRDFIRMAAQSDAFEILEAETVLALSKDADIRTFARHMIEDHQKTSAALKQAAERSGLSAPEPGISDDQSRFLSALQSLTGPDFDTTYAKQQVLAHRSALAVEQKYARSGDDANLRGAAAAAVPLIQAHLAMIAPVAAQRSSG